MRRAWLLLILVVAQLICARAQDYSDTSTTSTTHEYVDLGLSVNWATCNVGAYKPEEYGDYYAWGETITKDYYDWIYYKFEAGDGFASDLLFNKYVSLSNYSNGVIDGKMVLDPEDDVAHIKWDGSWRMPTKAELEELCDSCTWNWTTLNGVNGYMVTGKKPGYEDHSIFLPAVGCIWYDRNGYEGKCAYYSSSSLSTEEQEANWCLWFIDPDAQRFWKMAVSPDRLKRAVGQCVRPVCPKRIWKSVLNRY